MVELLRSVAQLRYAVSTRPHFWVTRPVAELLDGRLPEPWLPVSFDTTQIVDGEEAVCFKHPERSRIVKRAQDGDALLDGDEWYLHRAYGPSWRDEL